MRFSADFAVRFRKNLAMQLFAFEWYSYRILFDNSVLALRPELVRRKKFPFLSVQPVGAVRNRFLILLQPLPKIFRKIDV